MNLLICSIGRHAKIVEEFKKKNKHLTIITTSNSDMVAGVHLADKHYILPDVQSEYYMNELFEICKKDKIDAVTTMLDIETEILSRYENEFNQKNICLLTPNNESAKLCLDKYEFYNYVTEHNINTILTFQDLLSFEKAVHSNRIDFPVFVKPKTGRGSVGTRKVENLNNLQKLMTTYDDLIIQEYIDGVDIDIDVYIDSVSKKAISMFAKEKLKKGVGGASETKSYVDVKLFNFIEEVVSHFNFSGPINIDVFYYKGNYYLTEINPRLGATYIHAIGAGVDFIPFIENNVKNRENLNNIISYQKNSIMLTYNSAVIVTKNVNSEE